MVAAAAAAAVVCYCVIFAEEFIQRCSCVSVCLWLSSLQWTNTSWQVRTSLSVLLYFSMYASMLMVASQWEYLFVFSSIFLNGLVACLSANTFDPINKVTLCWTGLVL